MATATEEVSARRESRSRMASASGAAKPAPPQTHAARHQTATVIFSSHSTPNTDHKLQKIMSKTFNPSMSMEYQAEALHQAAEDFGLKKRRSRALRKKFFNESNLWQEFHGDDPIGAPFMATSKEVLAMRIQAEKVFCKALNRTKPGKPKPRLARYELVVTPKEPAPEKKLWEQ